MLDLSPPQRSSSYHLLQFNPPLLFTAGFSSPNQGRQCGRDLAENGGGREAEGGDRKRRATESPKPPTSIFRRHSKCVPFLFFLLLPLQPTPRAYRRPINSRSLYLYLHEGEKKEIRTRIRLAICQHDYLKDKT
ncbi:hypothetical protein BDQ94DRAFT_40315 [Aspergillus welwitschiae]|uniref:Uncharacterized protein n=1 Tax=Aspergillus welwitschiae TaxID=1341132 RepID=A0A3F3Q0R0_9EURO|nr:hypothetical protein BDQ94DRAFT_40315 [Aspergillus welwitschiae]RDH32738.1 hypothetical protein BDQ94DRAFT_40315 [Aspergillus welwitschiae]